MKHLSGAVPIVLVRLSFPVAALVFGAFFYRSIQHSGPAERLFPLVLLVGMALIAAVVIVRELHALVAHWRARHPGLVEALDVDGLRAVAWTRPILVAVSALIYYVVINRLGLLLTAFVVYVVCAGALIPDRSDAGSWIRCLIGAALTAIVLDLAFRRWLGLPLPAGPLAF